MKTVLKVISIGVLNVLVLTACGGGSDDAETTPIPPSNKNTAPTAELLKISANGAGDVVVIWKQSKDDTTPHEKIRYEIHMAKKATFTPSESTLLGSVMGGAMAYSITRDRIERDQKYYIKLVAVDKQGLKTTSKPLNVTVDSDTSDHDDLGSNLTVTGVKKCADYAYLTSGIHNNDVSCLLNVDSDGDPIPVGQDGAIQAGKTNSYSNRVSGINTCIEDKVTGLTWETKTDDKGLRDKNHTYTWFSPDANTNGADVGVQNGGYCNESGCDTNAYIFELNRSNYCGYNDWRMPTQQELFSLVDYSGVKPNIDSKYFPNTKAVDYWTSESTPFNSRGFAFSVGFQDGSNDLTQKKFRRSIRAVR